VFVHGDSVVHRLPSEVKLVALAVTVLAVVATPRERVEALVAEAGLVAAAAVVARVPSSVLVRRLSLAVPFLLAAAALPFVGGGPRADVLGVAVSTEGLWAAWAIAAKGVTCVAAAVVVTATTTVSDLLAGLSRLRAPSLVVGIASFMVRYVDVLVDEAARMRTAMAARGYRPRWMWQAVPSASAASTLFVRSYERGERTYDAMVARGYSGRMPPSAAPSAPVGAWARGLAIPVVLAAVAVVALVANPGVAP
jgi:cobalt/nickel transport system permease protein